MKTLSVLFTLALVLVAIMPAAAVADEKPTLNGTVIRNMTYNLGEDFKLVDGIYRHGLTVVKFHDFGFGDLDGDGKNDAAVILLRNDGGSASWVHLVVVTQRRGGQVASVLLGDRVRIQAVDVVNGTIEVRMHVHGPDDGRCCPSRYEVGDFKLIGRRIWRRVDD